MFEGVAEEAMNFYVSLFPGSERVYEKPDRAYNST
jgi:predicted 3-demethylubiquinone-9 3-methyltransferase (glyoxalase superfamily)